MTCIIFHLSLRNVETDYACSMYINIQSEHVKYGADVSKLTYRARLTKDSREHIIGITHHRMFTTTALYLFTAHSLIVAALDGMSSS